MSQILKYINHLKINNHDTQEEEEEHLNTNIQPPPIFIDGSSSHTAEHDPFHHLCASRRCRFQRQRSPQV